jgi:hypothetical protein
MVITPTPECWRGNRLRIHCLIGDGANPAAVHEVRVFGGGALRSRAEVERSTFQ